MSLIAGEPLGSVAAGRGGAVQADVRELDGRLVGWFRLEGGKHDGAIGPVEGDTLAALIRRSCDAGIPVVGVVATSGADVSEGVAALHAWGRVARAMASASGVVPLVLIVIGPCLAGPSLLLGLADAVVMTSDAFAYISGPAAVASFTGVRVASEVLGGAAVHAAQTGVASLVVDDEDHAVSAVADLLSYLPSNNMEEAPTTIPDDPLDRPCEVAASTVPTSLSASYDIRQAISDIVDDGSLFELRERFAPNLVTALARLDGRAIAVVANQPRHLAGTLDIAASQKGARFVQWCDAFNLPIVTFVDTPGFQPGRDLEWRGMIRLGAELVYAYAVATVPRLSVIVRKAYGGAYIVMDSKAMGSDHCVAWPNSEVAVMGAAGAVQITAGRRLDAIADPDERARERQALEEDYTARYCTPAIAAERGYLDDIVDPADTRRVLGRALRSLASKREHLPRRRHGNSPL